MAKTKKSDDRNVRVPDSISVIRGRSGMYIGDNTDPSHLIEEGIDNIFDEIRNKYGNTGSVSINNKTGIITICDNSRGLPLGTTIIEETGQTVDSTEILFTKLHSGTKFSLENDKTESSFGQNGLGNTIINALSNWLDVLTKSAVENKLYHLKFEEGKLVTKELIERPDNYKWSTQLTFKPSKDYFDHTMVDQKKFEDRLILAQSKIEGSKFFFNNKELKTIDLETFVRNKLLINKDTPLYNCSFKTIVNMKDQFSGQISKKPANITVWLTYEQNNTVIMGDVNLRFCEGTYLNELQKLIKKILPTKLDKKFHDVPERFLIEGLRLYASLQYPLPTFDSQSKKNLTTKLGPDIIEPLDPKLKKILSESYILDTVSEILSQKIHGKVQKSISKKKISSDNKLLDCIDSPGNVLYIVEGDSANASIRDARNKHTAGSLPIRGKIINVESNSITKISENKEIKYLLEAMGTKGNYRYNNIEIVTDADCILGTTMVPYIDNDTGQLKIDQIQNLENKNFSAITMDPITQELSIEPNTEFVIKSTRTPLVEFDTGNSNPIVMTETHKCIVYDNKQEEIVVLMARDVDPNRHSFVAKLNCDSILPKNTINKFDISKELNESILKPNTSIIVSGPNKNNDPRIYNCKITKYSKIDPLMTKVTIANKLNMNGGTIDSWIKGINNCSENVISKLKQYYNIEYERIYLDLTDSNTLIESNDIITQKAMNCSFNATVTLTKEHMFLIGAYLGDGSFDSSKKNPYAINIALSTSRFNLPEIIRCCDKLGYGHTIDSKSIHIKSLEMYCLLNHFGLHAHAHEKFIPYALFGFDKEMIEPLLSGYFSTDGNLSKSGSLTITSTSYNLLFGMQILLAGKFKIYSKIKTVDLNNEKWHDRNTLSIYSQNSEDGEFLIKWYNNPNNHKIPRSIRHKYYNDDTVLVPIKSKEHYLSKDKVQDVYCFKCPNFHNFINENNVAGKNSDGHHLAVLLSLILAKYFPDLVEEGKCHVLIPPLYGAIKNKEFIPCYTIDEANQYRNKGYSIQRFKGLGEISRDKMEKILNNDVHYTLKMPTKEEMDNITKIITDSEEKRRYLNLVDEYSFTKFLKSVLGK